MSFTHPTPLDVASGTAEAYHGARFNPVNALLPAMNTAPDSSPSLAAQFGNFLRHLMYCADTNLRACRDGTLTVGVRPGRYRAASTAYLYEGQAGVALTNNATNYVYLVVGDATVTVSTVGFPGTLSTFIPIAVYVCAGGVVTTEDWEADRRPELAYWVDPAGSSPTGTTATSFTMDDDNAGAAAASIQLRANRGSTDSEDAAIEWVEADDRWRFRAQHSTVTLAGIDALALYISGSLMVGSNGAAKVTSAVAGDGLAHASGVLSVDTDASTIETSGGSLQLKAGGVATTHLSDALADSLAQVSIANSSGASPRTVTIQALDAQGNNLAEVVYFWLGVFQASGAGAFATNATIADGGAGSVYDVGAALGLSAGKLLQVQTDSTGLLEIAVTDGTLETVYLKAMPGPGSKWLKCDDIGTVVIA